MKNLLWHFNFICSSLPSLAQLYDYGAPSENQTHKQLSVNHYHLSHPKIYV